MFRVHDFNETDVDLIEAATRGQATNKLWIALHNGRITSSKFGEILHRKSSTNPQRDYFNYSGMPMITVFYCSIVTFDF